MALYWMKAIDDHGKIHQAYMEFQSQHEGHNYCHMQQWSLISLRRIFLYSTAVHKEICIFFFQMACALGSGHSLSASLDMLAEHYKGFASKIFLTLSYHLYKGALLSDAMALFPKIFSPSVLVLIKAGEMSGRLPFIFKTIHKLTQKELHYKKSLQKSFAPFYLNGFFFLIAFVVLTQVLMPEFEGLSKNTLRTSTRLLFFLKTQTLLIFLCFGLLAALILFIRWVLFHYRCFAIAGSLRAAPHYYEFFLSLSILLEEDINLTRAIKTASESIQPLYLKEASLKFYTDLHQGKDFNKVLTYLPFLPSLYVQILKAGHTSGHLVSAFKMALELLEEDLKKNRQRIIFWLGPFLMLAVGFMLWLLVDGTVLCLYQNMENLV